MRVVIVDLLRFIRDVDEYLEMTQFDRRHALIRAKIATSIFYNCVDEETRKVFPASKTNIGTSDGWTFLKRELFNDVIRHPTPRP